jgi:hypothetical protein
MNSDDSFPIHFSIDDCGSAVSSWISDGDADTMMRFNHHRVF